MKHCLSIILFSIIVFQVQAQLNNYIHEGTFRKGSFGMSSHRYQPDDWEKPLMDSAIRYAFPSNLVKDPEKFRSF